MSVSRLCLRAAIVLGALVVSFYIGRPVFWAVSARLHEAREKASLYEVKNEALEGLHTRKETGQQTGSVTQPVQEEGPGFEYRRRPGRVGAVDRIEAVRAARKVGGATEKKKIRLVPKDPNDEEEAEETEEESVEVASKVPLEPKPTTKDGSKLDPNKLDPAPRVFEDKGAAKKAVVAVVSEAKEMGVVDVQTVDKVQVTTKPVVLGTLGSTAEKVGELAAVAVQAVQNVTTKVEAPLGGLKNTSVGVLSALGEGVGELAGVVVNKTQGVLGVKGNDTLLGGQVGGVAANITADDEGEAGYVFVVPVKSSSLTSIGETRRPLVVESRPLAAALKNPVWDAPAPGSEMPPRDEFALRREMVEFRAKNFVIFATFANHAFMDFAVNWARHLTAVGVHNLLVGAMDTGAMEGLFRKGIPTFDMDSHLTKDDPGWGSATFHKMGREKVFLINAFLGLGYDLVMCDTDMVWTRDPQPFFARYPTTDVLTSSDNVINTVKDESLERYPRAMSAYNIGILYFRPSRAAKAFVKEWQDVLLADDKIWDQNAFNDIMRRKLGPEVPGGNGLFRAFDGNLTLGILPVSVFCSGHTYFVQKMHKKLGLEPYAVHTTYQYAGTDGKRHRLREAMLWQDDSEYYDAPGGLLVYNSSLQQELLTGGKHSVETHFRLVNHQLVQVRTALALATALNRTLVMPELWARLDRMWFPHDGILAGTDTPQPFLCPMDHIFEVNRMLAVLPEDQFGPIVRFREYSFLRNPNVKPEVLESRVRVVVCPPGKDRECEGGPGKGALTANATDVQVREQLQSFRDVKVLDFESIDGAFGGFAVKADQEKFERRVKNYVGIWCCVHAQPGHIYYDMFWDRKPGWVAKPPKNPSEDHPPQ